MIVFRFRVLIPSCLLVQLCFLRLNILTLSGKITPCEQAYPSCRSGPSGRDASESQICLRRFANVLSPELLEEVSEKHSFMQHEALTGWASTAAAPRNVYERAAAAIASTLGIEPSVASSVEYWARSGFPSKVNFHFDREDSWADCAAFPWVSTILYLDNLGPPTLVLSKSLSDRRFTKPRSGPANDTSYLSWPVANHLVEFSGDLFHGIHMPDNFIPEYGGPKRRVMLFNFWRHTASVEKLEASPKRQNSKASTSVGKAQELHPQILAGAVSPRRAVAVLQQDNFGARLEFELTYRVPEESGSIHRCMLDADSWQRMCATCQEYQADLPFFSIPGGVESVEFPFGNEAGFEGNLFGVKSGKGKRQPAEL